MRARPQLPHARVRLVVQLKGALPGPLKAVEIIDPRRPDQTSVEEGLGRRENDVPIDVMLEMLEGLIADRTGPMPRYPGKLVTSRSSRRDSSAIPYTGWRCPSLEVTRMLRR